jgi:hypothetical protein
MHGATIRNIKINITIFTAMKLRFSDHIADEKIVQTGYSVSPSPGFLFIVYQILFPRR